MKNEIKQTNDIIYDLYKLYIPIESEYYEKVHNNHLLYDELIEQSQISAMKKAISASRIYADMIHELLCEGEKNERTNNRSD